MIDFTAVTGFVAVSAMPSVQGLPTRVQGTASSGRPGSFVWSVTSGGTGLGIAESCVYGLGGLRESAGHPGLKPEHSAAERNRVRTGPELAPEQGEHVADRAEATPRRDGAVGQCPRRIPA
ncbi:hypothetical protein [Nocardiopsis sp. CNT312]|uniref:hypothetical protein n=1 Tax=Nocardiopsis sp. CNT312 TaxID=1137268 RepID=UPI00048E6A55|nr:hypothetical protein [Nocardiopsis sp. CNT312]